MKAEPAVMHQVADLGAVNKYQNVGDNAPVAPPPHTLTAHDRGLLLLRDFDELPQRCPEFRGSGVRGVGAELLHPPPRILVRLPGSTTTPTQSLQPDIVDSLLRQPRGKGFPAGVLIPATPRVSSDVHQHLDGRSPQERVELLAAGSAVTNGEKVHESSLSVARESMNSCPKAPIQ